MVGLQIMPGKLGNNGSIILPNGDDWRNKGDKNISTSILTYFWVDTVVLGRNYTDLGYVAYGYVRTALIA